MYRHHVASSICCLQTACSDCRLQRWWRVGSSASRAAQANSSCPEKALQALPPTAHSYHPGRGTCTVQRWSTQFKNVTDLPLAGQANAMSSGASALRAIMDQQVRLLTAHDVLLARS